MQSFNGFILPRPDNKGQTGKLLVSGQVTSSASTQNYTQTSGTAIALATVTYTGLIVKPSVILMMNAVKNQLHVYYADLPALQRYLELRSLDTTGTIRNYQDVAPLAVTNSQFTLGVSSVSTVYDFEAYE